MKFFQNRILTNIFAVVGFFSTVILFLILGYIFYAIVFANLEEIDKATKNDVSFVLNWCELGDEKIDKVLKSYVSETGFSSNHKEAYLIKIKDFQISDIKYTKTGNWYRGDQLPEILKNAVEFGTSFNDKTSWFIKNSEIFKDNCYVFPWHIASHGLSPDSVELIILKPKLNLIYYISVSI